MHVTGEPGREPQKAGVAFADVFTGLYATVAIQSALLMRQRTGMGQHVDMALFDVMTAAMANQATNALFGGQPVRMGNAHPNVAPYAVFPVSDGWFILAVGNDGQFARACAVLGLTAERDDPRFASNEGRLGNHEALTEAITAATRLWSRDTLLAALEEANVPAGPINSVNQALADPQIIARGMLVDADKGGGGTLPALRAPIRFSGASLAPPRAAPLLGEDDARVKGFSS
jgi:crotonobetainyl-CoA:carnitine CoA-transferase CaiB-like acyl-CoA transferase